jgi:hypothetical protein
VERVLLFQLWSETSIAANIEEVRETPCWIRLLKDAAWLEIKFAGSFLPDVEELRKLLSLILRLSKKSSNEIVQNSQFSILHF